MRRGTRRPRGAALMIAMVVVTVVTTMAAAMIWQQWRAVQVEAAERARSQSLWILAGALDWARMILREDRGKSDHLGEPWALPLAEARLSTFLAAEKGLGDEDDGPEAFLSGQISDATARYNLRELFGDDGAVLPQEIAVLRRLFESIGVPPAVADRIGGALSEAMRPSGDGNASPPLMPTRLDELSWLGIDAALIEQMKPYVTLLPTKTKVNLNTAPREVLAAVIDGTDAGGAERLVQMRQRTPFEQTAAAATQLGLTPGTGTADPMRRTAVISNYFEVRGRLRLEDRILEESWLVSRDGREIRPRQRLREARREGS